MQTKLKIGWASADITPDQNAILAGQFNARVSEGVMDPVTATALAVESVNGGGSLEQVIMVSCDLATIPDELDRNPDIRKKPRWYTSITKAYRRMERGEQVKKRFELQKKSPDMPIEAHVVRMGDVVFATNPFELYLDYATRIRELSKASQTFLIQKAGAHGTYLPSERSIACGGYGSVPASTDVGPEGGNKLVAWTTTTINKMFA